MIVAFCSKQKRNLWPRLVYEAALHQAVTVEECLSPNHLAHFIVSIIRLYRK